jgi:hypothetical protein
MAAGTLVLKSPSGGSVSLVPVNSASNTILTVPATTGTLATITDVNNAIQNRNVVINGNFDIWQRGTTGTATGYTCVDRWANVIVGTTQSVSRQAFTVGQTSVPNNPTYYYRNVVTSVAGAGNVAFLQQRIEGVQTLSGQSATISFWAKADAVKNIAIELYQYMGSGGSPSSPVVGSVAANTVKKFGLTTNWTYYTYTFSVPSITGKTLGSSGDHALWINIWMDGGSTYDSRTDSLGQQSGTFDISQVQFEAGSVTTKFDNRPVAMELLLCQRYYQLYIGCLLSGYNAGTGAIYSDMNFQQMRATPTPSISNIAYSNASSLTMAATWPNHIQAYAIITTTSSGYAVYDL